MKRVRVIYGWDVLTVLAPADDTIRTEPDRSIGERMIYAEAFLAEHCEMDCGGGGTPCAGCCARFDFLKAAREEDDRRQAAGITIEDPDEPTLEERLGPYGIEWQIEQRERTEGRA